MNKEFITKKYIVVITLLLSSVAVVAFGNTQSVPPQNNYPEIINTGTASSTKTGQLTVPFIGGNFLWSGNTLSVGTNSVLPVGVEAYINGKIGADAYCNELGQKCVTPGGVSFDVDNPDWQSSWVSVAANGVFVFNFPPTINTLETYIYVEATSSPTGNGSTNVGYGGDNTSSTVMKGFYWFNKKTNSVSVKNGNTAMYYRVTVWKLNNPLVVEPAIVHDTVDIFSTTTVVASFATPCPASEGWHPFTATNGKFIMSSSTIGATGGASSYTLLASNIPAHTHSYEQIKIESPNTEVLKGGTQSVITRGTLSAVCPNGVVCTTASEGARTSFSIIPPYYTLNFCKYDPSY